MTDCPGRAGRVSRGAPAQYFQRLSLSRVKICLTNTFGLCYEGRKVILKVLKPKKHLILTLL